MPPKKTTKPKEPKRVQVVWTGSPGRIWLPVQPGDIVTMTEHEASERGDVELKED